jgi:flagellar FliJ protein
MRSFKFSLESLLNIKKNQKKALELRLSKTLSQLNEETQFLNALLNEKRNLSDERMTATAEGVKMAALLDYHKYYQVVDIRCKEQNEIIRDIEKQADSIQRGLFDLLKEIKLLENLKERKYNSYKQEIKIWEEKRVDEMLTYNISQGGGIYG